MCVQLKEEQPDLPFGEVGKELGVRWKSISDKDKKQYEDKAAEDKIRYTKEKVTSLTTQEVAHPCCKPCLAPSP